MAPTLPSHPGEPGPILGRERRNLCHFPMSERGGKGPHRQAQEIKRPNKTKQVGGEVAARGPQSGAAARAASGAAVRPGGPLQGDSPVLLRVPVGAGLAPLGYCWAGGGRQLPGALQLLSQPGGQRLPHLVQELGELYVMVPVIVPQEGARLQRDENRTERRVRGTSPEPTAPARPPQPCSRPCREALCILTSESISGYFLPLLFPKHFVFPPSRSWHQNPFFGSNLRSESSASALSLLHACHRPARRPPSPAAARPRTGTLLPLSLIRIPADISLPTSCTTGCPVSGLPRFIHHRITLLKEHGRLRGFNYYFLRQLQPRVPSRAPRQLGADSEQPRIQARAAQR